MNEFLIFDSLNFSSIVPLAFLSFFAIFLLIIGIFNTQVSQKFFATMSILAIILNIAVFLGLRVSKSGFDDLILLDGLSVLASIVLLVGALCFISLSLSNKKVSEYSHFEYYVLYLFMLSGYEFMVSSSNLLIIFIGLEFSSLALYILIAMRNRISAIEASIKYFSMGAVSSGFFAFGVAIFYMLGGSFDIGIITKNILNLGIQNDKLLILGCVFMVVSIGFKLSLIPFHTWVGDVYEGASALMSGFLSIVPKVAGFVVAIRLFEPLIIAGTAWLGDVLYIISILTMTLANIMALIQSDVKRMLAYSSIVHVGFVLGAIVIHSNTANNGFFIYWIMFLFANLGAFTMLYLTSSKKGTWDERFEHPYSKFNGLIKTSPFLALPLAIFMLNLAGVPPFGIFWGKMYLMSAAINDGFVVLALAMMINSVISVYYYLKLVVHIFLKEPIATKEMYMKNASYMIVAVLIISVVFCLISPLLLKQIINFVSFYLLAF